MLATKAILTRVRRLRKYVWSGEAQPVIGALTISDMARASGVTTAAMSKIFSGANRPSLQTALVCAEYVRNSTGREYYVEHFMADVDVHVRRRRAYCAA